MDDLIAFLRARVADSRERILDLRRMTAEDRGLDEPWTPEGHDPVMVDLDAKRRIIDVHEHRESSPRWDPGAIYCVVCDAEEEPMGLKNGWCITLRLLALPFADHPDYNPSWRP